jgi:hypothetical protein
MKDSVADFHFIRASTFDRAAKGLLSDEDERVMESEIAAHPKAAPVIKATGGVRKIRVATGHRGKRGSTRVLYLFVETANTVYLLFAFAKNVADNISGAEKKSIATLVKQLKNAHEP